MWRSSVAQSQHPVADAALGADTGGVPRVVAELTAELLHEAAHRVQSTFSVYPYLPKQRVVRGDPSRVDGEDAQRHVLGARELHRTSGRAHPSRS